MKTCLCRQFHLGSGVAQPFQDTNGIIQGCPLRVVLLNLLVNVWARAVKNEVPQACPSGYADDTGATSAKLEPFQKVSDSTADFARVTRQVLNATKSSCWSTCVYGRGLLGSVSLLGDVVPPTSGGRLLGAHVSYQRAVRNQLGEARCSKGVAICERIRWAPLPMHVRAQLLAFLVMPSTLYASRVSGLVSSPMLSLTSAAMRSV